MEEFFIKQAMDDKSILYYKRYVDDLLITYDNTKTGADMILNTANELDSNLTFKVEIEVNNSINYLDLRVNKSDNQITIDVYRKPTYIDITIHYTSNHRHLQNLASFHFFIQRLNSLPPTERAKEQELIRIITTARNNGFPEHIIQELKHKHYKNNNTQEHQTESVPQHKKWSKFQFHSPAIYKITNMFMKTNVKIAFKATNTIFHQLTYKPNKDNPAGIYTLRCNTCKKPYVEQTGRDITTPYKEHVRYIKNCNPVSANSMHILNNRHEWGTQASTLRLLKQYQKGSAMNIWESMYSQAYGHHNILVGEQNSADQNPLFNPARVTESQ
jgi:hypothetical protein